MPSTHEAWIESIKLKLIDWSSDRELGVASIPSHRKDHLLGRVRTSDGHRYFLKAFQDDDAYCREVMAHLQLRSLRVTPQLIHNDDESRAIILEEISGNRLGATSGVELRRYLHRVPEVYAALVGLPCPNVVPPARDSFEYHYARIEHLPEAVGLPEPGEVLSRMAPLATVPIHGDFQPSNLLVDGDNLLAIDFESYGPDVPALDAARMAYNPMLDLNESERAELFTAMIDHLEDAGYSALDERAAAACCCYWAVCCAAYFQEVLSSDALASEHTPEAGALSTRPLQLASDLWQSTS